MSAVLSAASAANRTSTTSWPMPVILMTAAVALALLRGEAPLEVLSAGADAFASSASGFLFILLPSFVLAAFLARETQPVFGAKAGALLSPVCAAAMVCPDTGYAVLSPGGGTGKLPLAFGSYAGFKLLAPAGPLIVATALGVPATWELFAGAFALAVVAVAAGSSWAAVWQQAPSTRTPRTAGGARLLHWAPMGVLLLALIAGLSSPPGHPVALVLGSPAIALCLAAVAALLIADRGARAEYVERSVSRTSRLLFMIGAAGMLGSQASAWIDPSHFVSLAGGKLAAILVIYLVAAIVKTAQGSSMVTFATVSALLAGSITQLPISPTSAVLAICAGSFAVLLPNDSFYWLVRTDALKDWSEKKAMLVLSAGSAMQSLATLGVLLLAVVLGWI